MLLLIDGGDLYDPAPLGPGSVLVAGGKVLKAGDLDRRALDRLGVNYEVIDARDRVVVPGFLDPHEHLLGGSGEGGFAAQTPEVRPAEVVLGGITTAVGCLGVDTTMKTMAGLLGRAKALKEAGLSAYIWSGGYDVPPATLTGTVRNDILFIEEVIGAGEIAISDERSMDPDARELARLVHDTFIGGHLAGKAGVTHFHVGPGDGRLDLLGELIEDFDVRPEWLYPTHVGRNEKLMTDAVALAERGATVDVDVTRRDLARWLHFYRDRGGPADRLTASTDASATPPRYLLEQVRACVLEAGFALEDVLPVVTANTARVLRLGNKGRIADGADADLLVLEGGSLDLVEVIAGGRRLVRDGSPAAPDPGLDAGARDLPRPVPAA